MTAYGQHDAADGQQPVDDACELIEIPEQMMPRPAAAPPPPPPPPPSPSAASQQQQQAPLPSTPPSPQVSAPAASTSEAPSSQPSSKPAAATTPLNFDPRVIALTAKRLASSSPDRSSTELRTAHESPSLTDVTSPNSPRTPSKPTTAATTTAIADEHAPTSDVWTASSPSASSSDSDETQPSLNDDAES